MIKVKNYNLKVSKELLTPYIVFNTDGKAVQLHMIYPSRL